MSLLFNLIFFIIGMIITSIGIYGWLRFFNYIEKDEDEDND